MCVGSVGLRFLRCGDGGWGGMWGFFSRGRWKGAVLQRLQPTDVDIGYERNQPVVWGICAYQSHSEKRDKYCHPTLRCKTMQYFRSHHLV